MVVALMLSLVAAAPPRAALAVVRKDDPPVRVSLNNDSRYEPGDRARVTVRFAEDGYLVVLRLDAEGRVRVLFPVDPGVDGFVRGGHAIEIRGRGGRDAFTVDESRGRGDVLAARSVAPFHFDEFVRGDHWDYGALDSASGGEGAADPDAALLGIVQHMAGANHFDYDAVSYTVGSDVAYEEARPYYRPAPYGYGYPYYYYNGCYDPFFCGPYYYSAFYFSPFFFRPWYVRPVFVRAYRPFFVGGGRGFVPRGRPTPYRDRNQAVYGRGRPPASRSQSYGGGRAGPPGGARVAPAPRGGGSYARPGGGSGRGFSGARSAPAARGGGGGGRRR